MIAMERIRENKIDINLLVILKSPMSFKILIVLCSLSLSIICNAQEKSVYRNTVTLEEPIFGVAFGETYKGEVFMPYVRQLGVHLTKLYFHWHQ